MDFNINLARRDDNGLYRDVPQAEDFPAPGWDSRRYGWDREYYADLLCSADEWAWREIRDCDSEYDEVKEGFRPSDESLKVLALKFPENPRCQRLVELLLADDRLVVYIT